MYHSQNLGTFLVYAFQLPALLRIVNERERERERETDRQTDRPLGSGSSMWKYHPLSLHHNYTVHIL